MYLRKRSFVVRVKRNDFYTIFRAFFTITVLHAVIVECAFFIIYVFNDWNIRNGQIENGFVI